MTEVNGMETVFDGGRFVSGVDNPGKRGKVLLREPERCAECNKVFLSLYPLNDCSEHEDLDGI
ncbi:MAG: hypothetical protein HY884_09760 [Deltaproteobacteria bacterium]|nr:hypothetical protein [Deltaproteobacteria bacterium]